jgi:two-component system, NarL family, response regulator NreC
MGTRSDITVLLSEDHAIFRQGIRVILERAGFRILEEATNGREAVRLARRLHPDLAVVDLSMPVLNGTMAVREIARYAPRTRIVCLTMFSERAYVLEALKAGARGYVLKSQASSDLAQALKEVAQGHTYVSPGVAEILVETLLHNDNQDGPRDPLTPQEQQVLQLVAEGNTSKRMADILGIGTKTAESHRSRLMDKLHVRNTAGLVRYAVRNGLVEP